jgi:hypothetical protein
MKLADAHPAASASLWRPVVFLILLLLSLPSPVSAARVSARLSQETLVLGDSIDLTLSITDGDQISVPREIQVPGLTIQFSGQAQKTQIINRQISSSQELTYTVEGQKTGTFTIPPIEVRSEGEVLRTQPISLTVQAADASSERKREELVFAEITLSNSTGYVGEMIPAELRLFVDARVHWQAEQMPSFSGEGFTKQKMPEPTRERARRDGKDYDVIKFSTAITPSRAGKLMIGPGEISIQAQLPQERKNRQRSPLDSFFGDSFDPFFSTQPIKRITVKAPAVQLEVKPLPAEGRPKDFSGAVGSFRLSAEGSPKKVKMGDPLTMKLTVSGKSNFDRVNPPALRDSKGWRAYPPSVEFRPDDELATSGTKTFELALIPESGHTHMPVFDFSYFDPRLGKYVTLSSDAFPLEVTGTPPQEPVTTPSPPPAASPKPSEPDDLLGLLHEPGLPRAWPRIPLPPKPWVCIALILSGICVAAVAVSFGRPRDAISTAKKQRRREIKQLFSQLQTPDLQNARFLESASRILQIADSLQSGQPPQTVNVAEAVARRPLDAETREILEKLVRSRTDLLYAGKGDWEPQFSSEERAQVIRALKTFAERHARTTAL